MHFPQELWDEVSSYLTSFSPVRAATALNFKLSKSSKRHANLWGAIFKNSTWLQTATEHNVNPVLIGVDVEKYYRDSEPEPPQHAYMVLLLMDMEGDLQYKHKEFLSSLRTDFERDPDTEEYVSKRGLKFRLEGHEEVIYTKGADALFSEDGPQRQIGTKYSFWNDPKKILRCVQPEHIRGIDGAVATKKDLAPIFNLYLYPSKGDRPIQAIFTTFKKGSRSRIVNIVFSGEKDYFNNNLCTEWTFQDTEHKEKRYRINWDTL